jgi:hypothetical protein
MNKRITAVLAAFLAAAGTAFLPAVQPASAAEPASPGHQVTLTNFSQDGQQAMRFDTNGNALDAHDGEITRFGSTYYLYGTSYDCGYLFGTPTSPFCGFKVYSSPDLVHWTYRGYLFDATTAAWQQQCSGGCFRPHVLFSKATHKYVVWFTVAQTAADPAGYLAMTSSSPTGPFSDPVQPTLAVEGTTGHHGDVDLYVSPDGTGYVVYTAWSLNADLTVEQLTPDFLTGTGNYADLHLTSVEAPAMFYRDGLYYVTYSSPNCAYCTGTGTGVSTAPTPLGPWTNQSVSLWTATDGQLDIAGSEGTGIGLAATGSTWTDYTFSFQTDPLATGVSGGHTGYAQSGWAFRAQDPNDAYTWLLSNYPYTNPPAPGYLTKVIYRDGNPTTIAAIPLSFPVTAGTWYTVSTNVSGDTITTSVNGQVVDTTTDATYASGTVGFREHGEESADFRDVQVTAPDGTTLLSDDFTDGLSQWDPPTLPYTFTANSCGGQPSFVATLPAASGGSVYLYGSDLWDGQDNEALANYYWQPLQFGAAGQIEPLTCSPTSTVALRDVRPGPQRAVAHQDQTSGVSGFTATCPVAGADELMQTFTAGRTGVLRQVVLTGFQGLGGASGPEVNAPLTLQLVTLASDGGIAGVLSQETLPSGSVGFSARNLVLAAHVPVTRGATYAVVASSASTQACYGVAESDANPYPRGYAAVSTDGGQSFTAQPGTDLKFYTVVAPRP